MTYFDKPSDLAPVTKARSVDINNLAALIAAAFGKLPAELDLKMGTVNYAVNTGPNGTAYAVVMASAITAYVDGLEVRMRPVKDNTGACTLNVNGIGAIAIKRADGTDPQAGDIIGNTPIALTYQAADNVFHLPAVVNSQIVQAASSSTQAQASAAAAAVSAATALKTLAIESDNPPANPIDGQEWTDAGSGRRYTWNANSSCWAETYAAVTIDNPALVDQLRTDMGAPYVITGVASIKNPTWGAPVDNATDPGAAAANATAAQKLLNSGAKRVEFDDKARYVNATLVVPTTMRINGAGRAIGGLVWNGGDAPVLARAGYANASAAGLANIRLHDLLIQDKAAARVNNWTVDLTNGDSCGIENCWIDIQGAGAASDKYGLALGAARGGNFAGLAFVAHIRNSRIAGGKALINTSDWYVSGSELWGNGRDHALMLSAGGTVCDGTQIVPGSSSGIYLFNDSGFSIDTLKVADVFFDGSYNNVVTGTGIKSAPGIGLITSEINGCNFWHLNGSGIDLASTAAVRIDATFADCDSMGVGLADIIIAAMQSTDIKGRHFRNANAPKTNAARVLGPVLQLTGQAGFPINQVDCLVSYSSTYLAPVYTNPGQFKTPNGSALTKINYPAYPDAALFKYEIVTVGGAPRFSNGVAWFSLTNTAV